MKHKLVSVLFLSLVPLVVSAGCATSKLVSTNGTNSSHPTKTSGSPLTESQVVKQIQNNETGHSVNHIHIIYIQNNEKLGAAFASFMEDGKLAYVNIFNSATQGTGYARFLAPQTKGFPIQSDQQVAKDGYTFVSGVVDNPNIKNVVFTFAKGNVEEVPVHHGDFWFFGKVGNSEADAYTKNAIGVTDQGEIVMNH